MRYVHAEEDGFDSSVVIREDSEIVPEEGRNTTEEDFVGAIVRRSVCTSICAKYYVSVVCVLCTVYTR